MRITVLGSGQDAGVPQLFCACRNCQAARKDASLRRRPSSLGVEADGARLVLDCTPAFSQQVQDWIGSEAPDALLLTHAHMGHVGGLIQLGKEGPARPLDVYAAPGLHAYLGTAAPYADALAFANLIEWPYGRWVGRDGVRFRAHPINHRAERSDTVGIEVEHDGRRVLYIPDTDALDDAVLSAAKGLGEGDVFVFDATFWSADELPADRMAQVGHPPVEATLIALAPLRERGVRVVYSHLNHTNPLCDSNSRATKELLAAGFVLAHDGAALP